MNAICTTKGGTHVNNTADQICERVNQQIQKKHKNLKLKPFQIKQHLWLFVNCLIENPAFDSQTKETLTTRPNAFGSKCELSERFLKELLKAGLIDNVVAQA